MALAKALKDEIDMSTGLQFTLKVEGTGEDAFKVLAFDGNESLSSPYFFSIEAASRHENLNADSIVDQNITLTIWENGEPSRYISGIVSQFVQGDTGHNHTYYSLVIVPELFRLSLRQNSRIFQNQTVPEIMSVLLQEMGIDNYGLSLRGSFQQREYCVQYRESDLEFLSRIAAEEGIAYHFIHERGKHSVVFFDDTQSLESLENEVIYNPTVGGTASEPFIRTFKYKSQVKPSSVQLKDYSFKNPAYRFMHGEQGQELSYQRATYEHFDYPGRFKSDNTGKPYTRFRLQHLRADALTADGQSNVARLTSGYKFSLTGHMSTEHNRDWSITAVSHQGTQPQALEEAGGEGQTTYHNSFVIIPGHRQWRATPNTKPRVDGPQIATVVGPDGEEIFCDEFGRVKVQFPWDRYSSFNEQSSCWIRVSQMWAGGQYGMIALPRIGHEVIVSFLEGDPDQPIITGRTYHATHPTPYPLPASKTATVLRTDTHKGEGYNELRFEDEADKEEIFVHAQKNMAIKVLNSKDERVDYDRSTSIGHDETLVVANDRKVTVEGQQDHHTTGSYISKVDGDNHNSVTGDWAMKVAGAIGIGVDGDITLKSGSKITLQVGGSFVVIHGGGVDIKGPAINLNSGGSPGSLPMPGSAAVLEAAAAEGAAFVAHCPAAGG
ncbi:type VI secretion system Vgr family protein [Enterovibrio norvegicus]|uniref:type VI secretion system Vgr family protein n=1 Tax=Enterovibrio norvegicus TaxID=188144 RepID=UPI002159B056|nr:type VI secretion system tip protein VgrG [Enterovibrio norvegicus]